MAAPSSRFERGEAFVSPRQLADYTGISIHTIYSWATRGGGPPRYTFGNRTRFRWSDVEEWLNANKAVDTS